MSRQADYRAGVGHVAGSIPPDHAPDAPGEWAIKVDVETGNRTIRFGCPLKPGESCGVNIKPHTSDGHGVPSWTWDGNASEPTLTPSVNCLRNVPGEPAHDAARGESHGCGWHGFLMKGRFT